MGNPVILKRLCAAGKMGCPSADAVETRSQEGGTTTQCGKNNQVYLVVDGCFKLSRSNKSNLLEYDVSKDRFFLPRSLNAPKSRESNRRRVQAGASCEATFAAAAPKPKNADKKVHDETGILGLFGTPLLFADLFGGELYSIVNEILLQFLKPRDHITKVFFFYDIGCKYKPHLKVF